MWLIWGKEVGGNSDRKFEMAKVYFLNKAVISRIFTLNGSLSQEPFFCMYFICIIFPYEMIKNKGQQYQLLEEIWTMKILIHS